MTLNSVQALRGIAALMVALYHVFLNEQVGMTAAGSTDTSALLDLTRNGLAGVDLFFVISGFIMVHVTASRDRGALASADFLMSRFSRIYPLWWLFSLGFLVIILAGTGSLIPPAYEVPADQAPAYLIRSFLLWPQAHLPYIVVGWTLIHEMYFYLVFALFLLAPARHLPLLLAGWLVIVLLGALSGLASGGDVIGLILHPLTFEFIAGAAAGLLITRGVRLLALPALVLGGTLFIGAVLWIDLGTAPLGEAWMRVLVFGLPSAVLIYGLVNLETGKGWHFPRALVRLGDMSYALYLCHVIVYFLALKVFELATGLTTSLGLPGWIGAIFDLGAAGPVDNLAFVLTSLLGAWVCAAIAHQLFERPSMRWLSQRRQAVMASLRTRS